MGKEKRKKIYCKPEFQIIEVDNVVTLQGGTPDSNNPPDPLNTTSSDNTESSSESTSQPTKENNFDENPFER